MKFLNNRGEITPAFIKEHICTHIPVSDAAAKVLDVGCDNFAIDFGDIIVRLPSNENALNTLKFEQAVCQHVHVPDLQTPKTQVVEAAYPFSSHKKIQGSYFLTEDYESLSDDQRDVVAKQLSEFLKSVHALPISKMEAIDGKNLPPYISISVMRDNADIVPDDLTEHFQAFLRKYDSLYVPDTDRVFGYFDAHGWNMAFDKKAKRLTGVYDFADCGFGDVHQDFHPMNTISNDLVKEVIEKYKETTSRRIDIEKVNFYTVLAEYSALFEVLEGKQTLMQKDLEHHIQQIRRWKQTLVF